MLERRRVCSKQALRLPLVYSESYVQPVYRPYLALCEGHRVCSTYRTTYRTAFREVRKEVDQTVYHCCPGWKKQYSHASTCDIAICDRPCRNGGTCSSPNTCHCAPGWGGKTCTIDVDECRAPVQLCSQRCLNSPGSYRCACLPGYALTGDGKSCRRMAVTASPPFTSPLPLLPDTRESVPREAGNEVRDIRDRLEVLEQKMQWTLSTFENLILTASDHIHLDDPMSLENTRNLIHQFQQLDRIDSLSEQIAFLEERLDSCSCRDGN
uniref:epidermal growth factor-like protein 7 n=1 Tax=Pristiophorus japonicus TaxID=55135 RepID=UPI00398EA315